MKLRSSKQIIAITAAFLVCAVVLAFPLQAEESATSAPTNTRSPRPTGSGMEHKLEELKNRNEHLASKASDLKDMKAKFASREAELKDKQEKLASRAAQRFEDRCTMLNERTTLILTRYEKNKTQHIEDYQNVKKRVEEVVKKLKAAGADTTKLEADLTQLNTLIQKAVTDYTAFVEALKLTKNYACGKSEGAYADALKSAQDKLAVARQDLLAIRAYYQSNIRPDVEAAKKALPSRSPKASTSVSSTPTASPTASPAATQ